MANRDDDPGAPKPLFVPPTKPGAEPSGSTSLFAPPTIPAKPGAAAPPVVVPSKPSATAPVFAEWPIEPAKPIEVAKPVEVAKPIEPAKPVEEAKPSESGPRAPLHARKTSTQAHTVVGEFGVPPPTDSKPSMPIVDDEDDAEDDTDTDDPERTDEDPQPLAFEPRRPANGVPRKRSSAPLLIGLGLAATLVVAIVVGMQDRGSEDPSPDQPKPNRSEPVDVAEPETKPRPPADTRTKLGDPPSEPNEPSTDATTTTTGSGDTTDTDTGGEEVDPRDPSVIPPGTPEENVKAFLKLPVSIHDGPPLGGIGRTGIHVDAISTGREYRSGECKEAASKFSIATDKEVSVCFRVVHDREEESVRILWEREGLTTRRGNVRIRDIHAYKTRAYLELRPEYVGAWRVRVISDDEVELASSEFEIGP